MKKEVNSSVAQMTRNTKSKLTTLFLAAALPLTSKNTESQDVTSLVSSTCRICMESLSETNKSTARKMKTAERLYS